MVSIMTPSLRDLPIEERLRIVEDLWDSIAAEQAKLDITPEQRAELDRRVDAFAVDMDQGRSANQVLADIRRRM